MAISTYSELKASIASWLHRDDLSAVIPDLIALCEAKVKRELRTRKMETRSTSVVNTEYIALPAGFVGMRTIELVTPIKKPLEYMTPIQLDARYGGNPGIPEAYTVIGGEIQLAPVPSGDVTIEMDYYKFDALSDASPTNWLLTDAPDVYLYGSLSEAESFAQNDQRVGMWASLYVQAVASLKAADKLGRWSGRMTVRADNV